ncbi:F0F1 ATP synthase subunit delta [soil metagenome]
MAEISTVARPYAEALFRVAKNGNLTEWSGIVAELAAVAANRDMQIVMADPKLSDAQIIGVLTGVIKTKLPVEATNFLQLLQENGKLSALPEIANQFSALKNALEGMADAQIVSAYPMSDAQVAELVSALEKKFKLKIKPVVTVDQSLIGGVRVVVGDQVLDTSVRAKLEQMANALAA